MALPNPIRLPPLPGQAAKRIALRVSAAAEHALREGHPWVFDQAIQEQSHDGRAGDLAVIFDRKRRFLAIGLYDPGSPIRVRVLQQRTAATIDRAWFQRRLQAAVQRREALPSTETSGYRLVHGENDGLPGLVIDRYGRTLALKLYTAAWLPHLADVLAALVANRPTEDEPLQRLVLRLSRAVAGRPELLYGLSNGNVLAGDELAGPVLFQENGLRFAADVVAGQKTGFFLDQRDNRARVESLAAGRRVLNVFAYTGGFSLYAARGGAIQVSSLDISRPALAAAVDNFRLNQTDVAVAAAGHELLPGDAFALLAQLQGDNRRFDLVIVDPPAFAKRQAEVERALAAYGRLAQLALGVLEPGGILVMASCSSRVTAEAFFTIVHQAARTTGRPLREIERTGHPLDHPIGFKEGAYLKCLFAIAP